MNYFLALLPILSVLILMLALRWGGQRAGPAGWLVGTIAAALAFGLNWEVWWVSQVKGLLLSLNVLAVLWGALLLYNLVDQLGGVRAVARALEGAITDRGLLLVIIAWAFSGLVEGLAGFGLPVAIVAPILLALGVPPLTAVAAVAVGHAWAVTFGSMGLIIQTLTTVTGMDIAVLAPTTALLLGIACAACGLGAAALLGQARRWPRVLLIALVMSVTQYLLAVSGLAAIGTFVTAVVGICAGLLLGRGKEAGEQPSVQRTELRVALLAYGLVVVLMIATTLIDPLKRPLSAVTWQIRFPQVATLMGIVTAAGPGQVFRPLIHPGVLMMISLLVTWIYLRVTRCCPSGVMRASARATWRAAAPASVGVISMAGLSTLMDHTGMTQLLAQGLTQMMGAAYPLVSPLIGMLGAFATGSNNNSNVLFAPLQKQVAGLLGLSPVVLVSAQTAGGSLGSMLAPAKLVVGCSTTGLTGQDGRVLRITLPLGLAIGLLVGLVTWLLCRIV